MGSPGKTLWTDGLLGKALWWLEVVGTGTTVVPLLVSGLENDRGGRDVTNVDPPLVTVIGIDGIVTGTDGTLVVVGTMGIGALDVAVPRVVSGVGIEMESGGKEVTTVDPPEVIVIGTEGSFVVIGAGPLVTDVLWEAEPLSPVDNAVRLNELGSEGLLGLTVGKAILVVRVPRVSEIVTPIERGGRLKLDWTGTLVAVVGTATLVVIVPRVSEIVTAVESGERLKLDTIDMVGTVIGTGTRVVKVVSL